MLPFLFQVMFCTIVFFFIALHSKQSSFIINAFNDLPLCMKEHKFNVKLRTITSENDVDILKEEITYGRESGSGSDGGSGSGKQFWKW